MLLWRVTVRASINKYQHPKHPKMWITQKSLINKWKKKIPPQSTYSPQKKTQNLVIQIADSPLQLNGLPQKNAPDSKLPRAIINCLVFKHFIGDHKASQNANLLWMALCIFLFHTWLQQNIFLAERSDAASFSCWSARWFLLFFARLHL